LTLRTKLFVLTGILCSALLILVGLFAKDAMSERNDLANAAAINAIADRYLAAGAAWAVERGAANGVIGNPAAATAEQRQTILIQRKAGDDAFAEAGRLLAAFADAPPILAREQAGVADAVRQLADLRARVDQSKAVEPELVKAWFPAITDVIFRAQNVRMAVERGLPRNVSRPIRMLFEAKGLLAIVSEAAGRERGAVAGIIAAGKPLTGDQYLAQGDNRGQIALAWTRLQILNGGADAELTAAIASVHQAYFETFEQVRRQVFAASSAGSAYPVTAPEWFRQATAAINRILAAQATATRLADNLIVTAISAAQWRLITALAIAAGILGLAIVSFWFIGHQIARPLYTMTAAMRGLAGGDLAVAIPGIGRHDEIGAMAGAVQIFKDNALEAERLKDVHAAAVAESERLKKQAILDMAETVERETAAVVAKIESTTRGVDSSAQEMETMAGAVSLDSQSVAAASEQALANVQTVSSAAEELSASIREISSQVARASAVTRHAVESGNKANGTIRSLSDVVDKISEVTKLIGAIADQTNLLALNAAIEAARAGEQGRGFAVVADEVRRLAERTTAATGEIGGMIKAIQQETTAAVLSMEEGVHQVELGSEKAAVSGSALDDIVRQMSGLHLQISQIATAAEQQTATTQEITHTVQRMTEEVRTTAAGAQSGAQASERLSSLAEGLESLIGQFKLVG
jgi:methyl-accepting chemotaxis protein